MRVRHVALATAALAAVLTVTTGPDARAKRGRTVDRSSADLTGEGAADASLDLTAVRRKGGELKKGTFRLVARGLESKSWYRLLMDDPTDVHGPSLVHVADVRSNRSGRLKVRFGKRQAKLPFGLDPARLAGAAVELRDASGAVVLSGAMPAMESQPPKEVHVAGAEHDCPFRDVTVEEHDFADDTVDAAPSGWTVADTDATAGRTILVDDSTDDGDDGQSVAIVDTDTTSTAGPSMTQGFTSQDGHMAVEFSLIPGSSAGRVVAQLGEFDGTTFTAAGGMLPGVGLHEDGQVGLGGSADWGAYTSGTAVTFRIDVDVDDDTFDLSIDGVVVATGLTLDLSTPGLSAIDAVRFTTGDSVTGSANVDGVRVLEVVEDCPPVADAGDDVTVECAGATTSVQLDGTGSDDPEGGTITYAWSGGFDESTATGATPSVTFSSLGTFDVTLVVNDGFSDSEADTVQVTVQDTTAPSIAAPADLDLECTGPDMVVDLGTPTVTDLCDPAPAVTHDAPDTFHLGTTTVTWTATDASGNAASVTQTVTISDTTPPTIVAPADLTIECEGPATVIDLGTPTVSDVCDPAPAVVNDAPADFHLGTHVVTWTATDASGNVATATQTVTVVDTTPPTLVPPADITTEGTGPTTPVDVGTPQVTDVCDPAPTFSHDAPTEFVLGTTVVTWTATDASGNVSRATQSVTIVDTTPPELEVSGLPSTLTTVNHSMIRISPEIEVSDIVDVDPTVTVVVTSSEEDDAQTGDGRTTGDIVVHSPTDIELRAERQGNGPGRVYTLVWTATDDSGNATVVRATISVPHSRGNSR